MENDRPTAPALIPLTHPMREACRQTNMPRGSWEDHVGAILAPAKDDLPAEVVIVGKYDGSWGCVVIRGEDALCFVGSKDKMMKLAETILESVDGMYLI